MKKTKKEYEIYLNEVGKKIKYPVLMGSNLRKKEPGKFQIRFEEHNRKN